MQCESCNYPLWNLSARECPECGMPFRPSDFEFVVNSVRFCCPNCDEAYYGTGKRGHLVPDTFECFTCSRTISMDEMVLRPTEGVGSEQTKVDRMPWFERKERGVVRAWLATLGAAMNRPTSLMRAIPAHVTVGRAWMFMTVSNLMFTLVAGTIGAVITAVLMYAFLQFMGGRGGGMPPLPGLGRMVVGSSAILLAAMIVTVVVMPLLWGWLTHGLLVVVGGASAPMRRTFEALCYSVGPNIISCVPQDCARLAGFVWWMVAAILMLKEAHKCSGGRATFAVLTSGFLVGGVGIGMFIGAFFLVVTSAGGSMFATGLIGTGETRTVTTEVLAFANDNNGAGPAHALQLVTDRNLGTLNFVSQGSTTGEIDIPVTDITLDEFGFLPPNRQQIAAQAAADLLPPNTVAHRLGDFVFTYHGVDLSSPPAGDGGRSTRWCLVLLPDPDVNGPPNASRAVFIGLADGSVVQMTYGELAAALTAENQARAADGLPPLPDPATVTHAAPGVAP
jgi:hypothetical protein